jgi:hypothetical protein
VQNAVCAQCRTVVGSFEPRSEAVRLFKWQISCRTLRPMKAPSATECLSASLMATLSRSGSAKVMVMPVAAGKGPVDADKVLYLWILNANITYASTEEAAGVKTAIKLLYRVIDRSEADTLLEPVACDIQDMALAREALEEAVGRLEASSRLLPAQQRRHQDWSVGLLDRYENS